MPPREDDDLSLLRALADDLILDVAEQDPARVIKALAEVCARLAAERHISSQELQTAVEVLLLEWHEQSSGRPQVSVNKQTERALRPAMLARNASDRGSGRKIWPVRSSRSRSRCLKKSSALDPGARKLNRCRYEAGPCKPSSSIPVSSGRGQGQQSPR